MRRTWHWGLLILAFTLLGLPSFSAGQAKAPAETPKAAAPAAQAEKMPPAVVAQVPAPTLDPKQVLGQMCDFLKNQPQFSFKAEVTDDRVYAGGRKLQYGLDVETFFRRPDKLRINGDGDNDWPLVRLPASGSIDSGRLKAILRLTEDSQEII